MEEQQRADLVSVYRPVATRAGLHRKMSDLCLQSSITH